MDLNALLCFLRDHVPEKKAVFGFDAFIDRIGRRISGLGNGAIDSMTAFGERLTMRGNRSGAVNLGELDETIGGNAPNTALALGALGGQVSCICALGYPRIRKVFEPLNQYCSVISYAEPGSCLALEMGQHKLFLGHNGEMNDLDWQTFLQRVGKENILNVYAGADLIGLFNWGELEVTQRIWEGLLMDVLPELPSKDRMFFLDFSDLSARSGEDVRLLKDTLRRFRAYGRVFVSANPSEAEAVSGANLVHEEIADFFITHGKEQSVLMGENLRIVLPTRYVSSPKRLTGGGDTFNAGFCYGLLCGLPLNNCLMTANAAANCLVRTAKAPDREELHRELEASLPLWS